VFVDNRTRDLEAQHLSAEHTVLDDGFGAGSADCVGQRHHGGVQRRLGWQRLGLGLGQRRAVHPPDGGRIGERRGPAGQGAGGVAAIDDEVQMLYRVALGPQQTSTQGTPGLLVRIDPGGSVLDEGGSAGKAFRLTVGLTPLPSDEGAQLGLAETFPPLVFSYFFFPPRAP
jgi:hypothetical protein